MKFQKAFLLHIRDLLKNDLKEEYLVHLFSSYFTDIDSSAVTDTMDSIDWETVVKKNI